MKVTESLYNITKVTVALTDKAVIFHYYNTHNSVLTDQIIEDHFILQAGEPNYNEFKKFAYSCLPKLDFNRLTFAKADRLCEELFNQQMNIALNKTAD